MPSLLLYALDDTFTPKWCHHLGMYTYQPGHSAKSATHVITFGDNKLFLIHIHSLGDMYSLSMNIYATTTHVVISDYVVLSLHG